MVQENDVKCIINCAAYTNVDKAETDEVFCELLNAKAVENLAVAMKEVDGLLIHVSTDYVFGGDPYNTPCKEDQKGTPMGVYGKTKLQGEQNILASGCHHIIIRTAWLYSEFGKNFVKTMLNLTATKPQLKVVFDQVGLFNTDLGRKGTALLASEEKDIFDKMHALGMQVLYLPTPVLHHIIPQTKLEEDYFNRLTLQIGRSERMRTRAISKGKYIKRLLSEGVKWGGTLVLFCLYTLQGTPKKGWKLILFRKNVTNGLLGG
jgi:hypothetical protein